MKRKGEISIGARFVEELHRLRPNDSDIRITKLLGCGKSMLSEWKSGKCPGAIYLASARKMGADLDYILLGRRNYMTESDHDICEFEEEI